MGAVPFQGKCISSLPVGHDGPFCKISARIQEDLTRSFHILNKYGKLDQEIIFDQRTGQRSVIKFSMFPLHVGLTVGIAKIRATVNLNSANFSQKFILLHGFAGMARILFSGTDSHRRGSEEFLNLGEVRSDMKQRKFGKCITIKNDGFAPAFFIITRIDPEAVPDLIIKPKKSIIAPGYSEQIEIEYNPTEEVLRQLFKSSEQDITISKITILYGDESTRLRLLTLAQNFPRNRFPDVLRELIGHRIINRFQVLDETKLRENWQAVNRLIDGLKYKQVHIQISHESEEEIRILKKFDDKGKALREFSHSLDEAEKSLSSPEYLEDIPSPEYKLLSESPKSLSPEDSPHRSLSSASQESSSSAKIKKIFRIHSFSPIKNPVSPIKSPPEKKAVTKSLSPSKILDKIRHQLSSSSPPELKGAEKSFTSTKIPESARRHSLSPTNEPLELEGASRSLSSPIFVNFRHSVSPTSDPTDLKDSTKSLSPDDQSRRSLSTSSGSPEGAKKPLSPSEIYEEHRSHSLSPTSSSPELKRIAKSFSTDDKYCRSPSTSTSSIELEGATKILTPPKIHEGVSRSSLSPTSSSPELKEIAISLSPVDENMGRLSLSPSNSPSELKGFTKDQPNRSLSASSGSPDQEATKFLLSSEIDYDLLRHSLSTSRGSSELKGPTNSPDDQSRRSISPFCRSPELEGTAKSLSPSKITENIRRNSLSPSISPPDRRRAAKSITPPKLFKLIPQLVPLPEVPPELEEAQSTVQPILPEEVEEVSALPLRPPLIRIHPGTLLFYPDTTEKYLDLTNLSKDIQNFMISLNERDILSFNSQTQYYGILHPGNKKTLYVKTRKCFDTTYKSICSIQLDSTTIEIPVIILGTTDEDYL